MLEHAPLAPVIAHRGASGTAPENTLAAIKLAAEHGAQCVELDASISADGIPFIHHDDTLDRCTNGTDYLYAHSAQQLDALFASSGKAGYENEPLPRLSACITLLTKLNMGLNLEIKPTPGLEEPTAKAVCEVLRDSWPGDLPLVLSSFSRESLKITQNELPGAARALIVCAVPETWHDQVQLLQCSNLHVAASLLTAEQAAAITISGLGLYCFTVNDVSQANALFDIGVHGVFSDYPKKLQNCPS
jgi:glycerophosphoryl diester phosphodiesterase